MTAINPAQLKIQAAEIAALVDEPQRLVPRLHDLFAFYGDRIRQTSLSKTPLSLRTYQAPAPVLRALEIEFRDQLEAKPTAGVSLADALWSEHWVEFRQLAVFSLSCLPPENPKEILRQIKRWLDDCSAEDIRRLVMTQGLQRLGAEKPEASLGFIEELIQSNTKADQQAALFGLSYFASEENFLNLPLLYKSLEHILASEETGLVKEVSTLLRILIRRSEQESAFFLSQQLSGKTQERVSRVARQVLKSFSPDNQHRLREKLAGDKPGAKPAQIK
ncbi:MAG: DNA alkylation repair protein [Anaerolineales bacterium]